MNWIELNAWWLIGGFIVGEIAALFFFIVGQVAVVKNIFLGLICCVSGWLIALGSFFAGIAGLAGIILQIVRYCKGM